MIALSFKIRLKGQDLAALELFSALVGFNAVFTAYSL